MLLALALLSAAPPKPLPLSVETLLVAARTVALDEGYPIEKPGYTFDTMRQLSGDDGFDSIGLYLNHHLLRMYSVHRISGDIVDMLHGCVVFRYENLKPLQQSIRRTAHGHAFSDAELRKLTGCPSLTPVTTPDAPKSDVPK
jgi:hypothetical protein